MKEDRRADRRKQIEAATHAVLLERGYAGASMLEVAKRAKASNETLYRWYGDKRGLFAALVKGNAASGIGQLDKALTGAGSLDQKLTEFAVALLTGILSDSAIELNRAAAADASGDLGRTIAEFGRNAVMPRLAQLLDSAESLDGFDNAEAAAETFITLLVGDLQARRIIGAVSAPDADFVRDRAKHSVAQFLKLAQG